jgi:KUP system potassium uptake protein
MVGTVIVTAVYNNTTNLGHAYGFCVILVTFITTNMVALVALIAWKVPSYIVLFVWLVFIAFDGAFLSSAAHKVPQGAWFTLVLAVVLSITFILWRFGKERQWRAEAADRFPPSQLISIDSSATAGSHPFLRFMPAFGGQPISRIPGLGIFFDKAGAPSTTPNVFLHFLTKFQAAPEVIIFFHLRPLERPSVPPEERYAVTRCYISNSSESKTPLPNCFRIIIRHGYNDEVITNDLGLLLFEQVRDYVIREGVEIPPEYTPSDENLAKEKDTEIDTKVHFAPYTRNHISARKSLEQAELESRLADLQKAYDSQVVYMVGKEQMRIKSANNIFKKLVLGLFLWIRENTRTKVQALNISVEKLVEVGFVKEI